MLILKHIFILVAFLGSSFYLLSQHRVAEWNDINVWNRLFSQWKYFPTNWNRISCPLLKFSEFYLHFLFCIFQKVLKVGKQCHSHNKCNQWSTFELYSGLVLHSNGILP